MSARAVAIALLLGVFATRPVAGQVRNHLYDKFQVSASGAVVLLGTTIRVDSDSGDGTEVDTEDDLGLDRAGLRPRIGFRWRPGRRHELEAFGIFISRTGFKEIEGDITVDTVTFTAGASLESRLRSNQLGVNYRWAIHASEKSQAGLSVGLGATFFDARFIGAARVSDGSGTLADTVTYERSIPGPTLAIGGFGRWKLHDKWYIEGDLRGLYVPLDNIRISIIDLGAAVRYFPLEWLGTELGYALNTQKVTIDQKDDPLIDLGAFGKLQYGTQNIRLGIIAAF